ncbi:hypothetical protein ACDH70_15770 [Xanthomonas axonopodis pv. poinsettiicola]|uniref:hypothetical protein n=1 Tax=Xanthomonas TaxID=338 RepID=UPI001E40B075|nr:hypothetical protein [Xanthomonas codiaei]MCC8535988.1 hypothetical protein [Xanthomonas codiaei]
MEIEKIDEITKDSFGLSLSTLFSSIEGQYPELDFYQRKEIFFAAIANLLKEGRIKFITPGADCYVSPENPSPKFSIENAEAHWNEGIDKIIIYLREKWPKDAMDDNDDELNIYFYEVPAVIWIDEFGNYFSS